MLNTVTIKNREAWNIHIPQFLGMAEPWGARVLLWRPTAVWVCRGLLVWALK